jgi:hypothetical protein
MSAAISVQARRSTLNGVWTNVTLSAAARAERETAAMIAARTSRAMDRHGRARALTLSTC